MTVAILGVGMMGQALLSGLLRAGWSPSDLRAGDVRPAQLEQIHTRHQVWTGPAAAAVDGADTLVIAVKPQDVPDLLADIAPTLAPSCLVISLAAGVTTATLRRHLPDGQPVIRVMPNTPALVGAGMTAIAPSPTASPDQVGRAERILSAVGQVVVLPEQYLDAVTAVSGSGPAYLMYVAEAMIDAAVLLGLPRATATQLVRQTLYGSAQLLAESTEHPTVLKENVVSPGGTTAAALRTFEEYRLKAAFAAAIEAARDRSEELGRG
jgi:pyrroline-5-carboxylate reductase